MSAPLKVIIDTDPGLGEPGSDIDDGLAIAYAVRSEDIDVLGLTIVNGNVTLATGVDVARNLADRLGVPELPVIAGANEPLTRDMAPIRALFNAVAQHDFHLDDSAMRGPNVDGHAATWMVEQARAHPGEITIIAIGPMTNLALAIQLDPGFAGNVREFVLMAGSATGYAQNITVVGDFNAYVDPEALDVVMRSGARIRMVGLDQTSRVLLTRDDAALLRDRGDDFSTWVAACTDAWIDFLGKAFPKRPEHQYACFLHDPLVIAAALHPELCTWEDAHVEVELESELARGLVVADRGLALRPANPSNAVVAIDTNVAAFRDIFLTTISTPPVATPVPSP